MRFDRIDLKILDLLQRDATTPIARISDRVGLSQTPCWKRIRKHEDAGIIQSRVAILDPGALGLHLTAFVMIEVAEHTPQWHARFIALAESLEPIRDIYRLAGAYDFMLRVVVTDMAAFNEFYEALIAGIALRSVESIFTLERIKVSTALPLGALASSLSHAADATPARTP